MTKKPKVKRSSLINKRFQFGTAGILALVQLCTFVTAFLAAAWLYLFVLDRRMVCDHNAAFLGHLGVTGAITLVLLIFWCIRRTHAIAGPIHKTRQLLRAAAGGDLPARPVRFRKGDCFKELADDLNACLETMENLRMERRQLLTALEEARAASNPKAPDGPGMEQPLRTAIERIQGDPPA
jgi:methyl-accepting chemotaxis protein